MKAFSIATIILFILVSLSSNGQNWQQIMKTCATDRSEGGLYGFSISVSGDFAIIGAFSEDFDADGLDRKVNAGAAYILQKVDDNWIEIQKLVASDRATFDYFGYSVAIEGDYAIVGAFMNDDNTIIANPLVNAGAAYVFQNIAGVWTETQKLVASDIDADDFFGRSVSISGEYAIIGSYMDSVEGVASCGSAYVFKNISGTWTEYQNLVASDKSDADFFGVSVSIDGDYAIVGAHAEDENAAGEATLLESGSAYIFKNIAGVWTQIQKIASEDRDEGDYFGYSVAINGNHAIIGAYGKNENNYGPTVLQSAGAAYVFENIDNNWTQVSKLVSIDRNENDHFGASVSINGDYAIVGAHFDDEDALGDSYMHNAGSAYVFRKHSGTWLQIQKIVPDDRQTGDLFGGSVFIHGSTVFIGAHQHDYDEIGENEVPETGAVYIYEPVLKDITVRQNNNNIPNNSTYFLGNVIAGNSIGPINFTIENSGLLQLELTGIPFLTISGVDSDYFIVDQSLISTPISSLDSTTFTVTFNSDAARNYYIQISIANNTDDKNPFIFIINAVGDKIPQTIYDFAAIPEKTYGDETFEVSALSTSGLDVVFTSSDPSIAICSGLNGTTITIVNAGECDIIANQAGDILYDVAPSVVQQLVVNPKELTVFAESKTKVFGDADPEFTYTYSPDLISGDFFSGFLDRETGEEANQSYEILQGSLSAGSNYILNYESENLTITPRPITVTASSDQTKIYGQADPSSYSYFISSGSLVGEDSFMGALTRELGENVGNYSILIGSLSLNSNYQLSFIQDDFEITPKTITVIADAGQSKAYGMFDNIFTFTYSEPPIAGNSFTGALSRESGEDVGFYPINLGTLSLGNNYFLLFESEDFEILPMGLNIVPYADQYKHYGQEDPILSYWITGALVAGDSFSGVLGREEGETIGFYQINLGTLTAGPNYNLNLIHESFEIKVMSIVVIADANQSKIYGDDDPISYSYNYLGTLAEGDEFTGELSRAPGENYGFYPITQGSLSLNSSYNISFISENFRIDKRPITVVADPNQNKNYGEPNPLSYSYSITVGELVSNDEFTGSITRTIGEQAGFYIIHQGDFCLNSNYTLTYISDYFEIIALPITVIADGGITKIYGESDPVFTYTANTSIINGNYFTGSLSREAGENVGTYNITLGNLSLGGNYTISFVSNQFEIFTKDLTIIANANQSKTYGFDDEELSYTTSSEIASWDNFEGSLTREQGEDVGIYQILQGSLELNENYNIDYIGNEFNIVARQVEVNASAGQMKIYGENDPDAYEYTIIGNLVDGDAFVGSLIRALGENAGIYEILQGDLALSENYILVYNSDYFQILKATTTIAWENPDDIFNNVALSSTQLNATADIEGSFYYNPDLGTYLEVGDSQPLHVNFIPTDEMNYNAVEKTVYINVLLSVGLVENNNSEISVYPNPSKGMVYFDCGDEKLNKITVYDISGKVLVTKKSEEKSIDLSNMPAGVYFVEIHTAERVSITKLVLQ